MTNRRLKNSVGIWAFGPLVTRFIPEGFHPESSRESMAERVRRAVEGLGDLVDGYEFHYPAEINEGNVDGIRSVLGKHDVYAIASGLHLNPKNARGAFTSPHVETRESAVAVTKKAIDLASDLKARLIIWPGIEGYNYPFQCKYQKQWGWFIDGIRQCVQHANAKSVPILLEHKKSEPAMKILMRNTGMMLYVIHKLKEMGTNVSNVKVNMDWQHLIMNGENLAEYAALLASEDLLGHQHSNSGWGTFDDDNMTGSSFFMQTLELAMVLQDVRYGENEERIGFDLFPYTEDPVAAVRRSVLQWDFIYDIARRIDRNALAEAQKEKDAVKAYQVVYGALGLTWAT